MSAVTYGPDLTVPRRYRGPARSGNGGYTAGTLAERFPDSHAVEVTLRQPPPLDVAMKVHRVPADEPTNGTGAALQVLTMGGARIAEARAVDLDLQPVDPVGRPEAESAGEGFPGFREHPFPDCFSCGTGRESGDGLRIFPGPVPGGQMAALWTPDGSLAEISDVVDEIQRVGLGTTWAALDCVGGWAGDMEGRRMVLGRMTAQVDELPVVGEPHVVVGAMRGKDRRKTFTASTLYDSDERIVARAEHVWIAVDPAAFN